MLDNFYLNSRLKFEWGQDDASFDLEIDQCPHLQPDVSIMIPTYRRPEMLRTAIASAVAQRTNFNFEIVILDNDKSLQFSHEINSIVSDFCSGNVRLYRNSVNIGMFGNWNRCIALARASWVTILNDDDLLDFDFLQRAWDSRRGNLMIACRTRTDNLQQGRPKMSFVKRGYGAVRDRFIFRHGAREVHFSEIARFHPITASLGVLFNREIAISVGGFPAEMYPSSDYIFTFRYWLAEGILILEDKLATYRIHGNDSAKLEVLSKWTQLEYMFRLNLVKYSFIGIQRKMLLSLVRYQTRINANLYLKFWNQDFDAKNILEELGLRSMSPFRALWLSRLTPYVWYALCQGFDVHAARSKFRDIVLTGKNS